MALAVEEVPVARPDERVIYSDINFFLLGHIVEKVSGQPLDRYAQERIFEPLGMRDTMFLPPAALVPRIAPDRALPAQRTVRARRQPIAGAADAARRGPRSDGAADGRRRRPRRPVHHRRRSGALLPDAARPAAPSDGVRDPVAADGRAHDGAVDAGRRAQRPRPRLGHRLELLVEPRRAVPARLVRPHRLHRHVDLDRSGDGDLRRRSCPAASTPTARATSTPLRARVATIVAAPRRGRADRRLRRPSRRSRRCGPSSRHRAPASAATAARRC